MTEQEEVKALCDRIGYGNVMSIASEQWKEMMIKNGHPVTGVFIPVLPFDIKDEEKENYGV